MTYPVIVWDPAVPNRVTSTRTQFNLDVNEFLASLPTLKTQINDANSWANDQYLALDTLGNGYTLSITALGDGYISTFNGYDATFNSLLTQAETAADSAADSASAAASSANFAGAWSTLTGSKLKGISVENIGALWLLLVDLADITSSEPSDANADWLKITPSFRRKIITANETLASGGQFFIVGDVDVTISTVADGDVFDFVAAVGSTPKIYGVILTKNFGVIDFVELDNQNTYQFVYNAISAKLEI